MRLSGTLSRVRWLAAHGLVIVSGLVVIVLVAEATVRLVWIHPPRLPHADAARFGCSAIEPT